MKTLPLSEIKISPNRQRKEFDLSELNELGESIRKSGLLHALVLRSQGGTFTFEPGDGSISPGSVPPTWFLVSGERRLRAISDIYELGGTIRYDNQDVPKGEVPFVDIGDLDELAREEAEFDENTKRANLTWQEEAAAVQRLAAARAKHAGTPVLSTQVVREVARTAVPAAADLPTGSLGVHQETTRRQIIVSQHLHDPDVQKAKDVNEAFKILRRKEDTDRRIELATTVGKTYSAETAHTALNEDAIAWMVKAAAEQFDVICTDPIYGIGADEFGDSGGHAAGPHDYEDTYDLWKKHAQALAKDGFRICKPQAHLYAFCDITRFEEFKDILSDEGWNCFRTPIIWHKPNGNRTPWVDFGPQRKFELILYANKGRKPVTRIYPDLVSYPADENLGHHAQKPVAVYVDLLRRSVAAGDKVLDPFAGSGPVLPAGQELKCKVTAIEIKPASYGICLRRLDLLRKAPELAGL